MNKKKKCWNCIKVSLDKHSKIEIFLVFIKMNITKYYNITITQSNITQQNG
jgi:hypothetical protein